MSWVALAAWWRARSSRERLLLRVAGVLLVVLAAGAIYAGAYEYRSGAAANLQTASAIEAQVARLERSAQAAPSADPSVRGRAVEAAAAAGVTVARVEPIGEEAARIAFQPADSLNVYRWIEQAGRRGVVVRRAAITRIAESNQVNAEFDVGDGS